MSEISDEIRKVADEYDVLPLYKLADHIDNEMVELPRDRNGVPIHVGDTVYMSNGRKVHVSRVNIARDHTSIDVNPCGTGRLFFAIEPTRFTHTAPDSWERIADEIEKADVDGCTDWADRIRKLAKERDGEHWECDYDYGFGAGLSDF